MARGRPRKITSEKDTNMSYPSVKQMVRKIAKGFPIPEMGVDEVWAVDAELDTWYQQGYTLFATHFLSNTPESYDVLYILTKEILEPLE